MSKGIGRGNYGAYASATGSLEGLGKSVCTFLEALLAAEEVPVHSVSHRVKTIESADSKMARKSETYGTYADLLDLLGIRIITYFPDDVDAVCTIVEREFDVDSLNSVDKREALAPNVFGYLSAHYVVALADNRSKLPEYRVWADLRFEVQVRSILQHAWAEIEHDLGYKSEEALPRSFRRRFSRLAGLLELADAEFQSIRVDLAAYQVTVGERVEASPGEVGLNQTSLRAWLERSEVAARVDEELAEIAEVALRVTEDERLARDARTLAEVGVDTAEQLTVAMAKYEQYIVKFFDLWWNRALPDTPERASAMHRDLPHGISFFYLAYVLIAQRSESELRDYIEAKGFRSGSKKQVIAQVRETWDAVVRELGEPSA
ncbi:GTP pyrophosphokinase [Demequina muriae]|uniref:RelA/SpoT domain-containing protein n=1 Tax=Demequina muriae TaxID=3051664 RepID=A0ABT8GII1_9MICO|nr:hypothetical protein [Demequina sp. EGI L300058]MDN4481243.1 hypothetical protein [Demequina sp. EGI L300058]